MLREKLALPRERGRRPSSSRARSRAASTDEFYAETIRDLNRRGREDVLDSEGEPLRLGIERRAVPRLAQPARGREPSSGRSSTRSRTSSSRSTRSPSSGRETCSSPRSRVASRSSARSARVKRFGLCRRSVEPVSTVGSGDALLAAFLAARHAEQAVGRGAASCGRRRAPHRRSRSGAGRFDPREASRLTGGVEVGRARASRDAETAVTAEG